MRRAVTLCGILVAAAALGRAQGRDPDHPEPPEMDDLSKRTMKAWLAKQYHLGRAGVRRALVTMEVKVPPSLRQGQPGRGIESDIPETVTCHLYWDGKSLGEEWGDETVGNMLSYRGFALPYFSNWFDVTWWAVSPYHQAKLVGRSVDGEGVAIDVTGPDVPPGDVYTLVFRPDGVLDRTDIRNATEKGVATGKISYRYQEHEGQCVLKELHGESPLGSVRSEIVSETVGGYVVPGSMKWTHIIKSPDDPKHVSEEVWEFRFTDWEFDDDPAMPPEMDDLAAITLSAWHANEHHLGRAGVHRATCTVEVKLPDGDNGPRATKGTFRWDGRKAVIRWEDEDLGFEADHGDLQVRNWCATWFEPWWKTSCYRGAKLTAKRTDESAVVIEFMSSETPYALSFRDNILASAEWGSGKERVKERVTYGYHERYRVIEGFTVISAAQSFQADYQYETVRGWSIPASIRVLKTVEEGGKAREEVSELRFRDWKLNRDVK